jgi:DNA-binding NarL/FixJ family response regulator
VASLQKTLALHLVKPSLESIDSSTAWIRLLIADDQTVIRAGFRRVLRREFGLKVMGAVASGEAALRFLECHTVDVLLVDPRRLLFQMLQANQV